MNFIRGVINIFKTTTTKPPEQIAIEDAADKKFAADVAVAVADASTQAKVADNLNINTNKNTLDAIALAISTNANENTKLTIDLDTLHDATPAVLASPHGVKIVQDVNTMAVAAKSAAVNAIQANVELDILNSRKVNDAEFELKIEQLYDVEAEAKLEELRNTLGEAHVATATFQQGCVETAITGLTAALSAMCSSRPDILAIIPQISATVMRPIAESWSPYLSCTTNVNDNTVNSNNKIFFTRVSQAIDAVCARCVFLSDNWRENIQVYTPPIGSPPPPAGPPPGPPVGPPVGPPPGPPTHPGCLYSFVNIGPYRYVVGPILDFQNIQGRIFIYIRCYSDDTYTRGTYFWAYRSQSEGLYRVFFKLIANGGAIEKGYDYTQATLVHFILQIVLCNYYELHKRRGVRDPIRINTLGRLNYFMQNMSKLQVPNFLDTFPGATIHPSPYSINCSTGNNVGVAVPAGQESCYVCLTQTYAQPIPPASQSLGMIGHYYMIDAKFAPIINRGFPLDPPPTPQTWNTYAENAEIAEITEARKIFINPDGSAVPEYLDFSRIGSVYTSTHPYIFCFTTCCMIQPCSEFSLFLNSENYKKTFWCQGFENYTAVLSTNLPTQILSPVLYVIIGALLQDPDMTLSTLRNDILNIQKTYSPTGRSVEYKKATTALMTLGTRLEYQEPQSSLYLPEMPDYVRNAALLAFKKIREKNNEVYISFKNSINAPSLPDLRKSQISVILPKVDEKINMVKCLALFLFTPLPPPENPSTNKMILFIIEMARLCEIRDDIQIGIQNAFTRGNYDAAVSAVTAVTAEVASNRDVAAVAAVAAVASPEAFAASKAAAARDARDAVAYANAYANPGSDFNKAKEKAFYFINASPHAAAAALFGYVKDSNAYKTDLIGYALLCLKKDWVSGMIDDAYRALEGVYNPTNTIYNYLGPDGKFYPFTSRGPTASPAAPPPAPYLFKSSFDETRKEDTSPTNRDPDELNVTVVTFANVYRLDSYYSKVFTRDVMLPSCMSMLYQISSTIVYTRELNPQILYAIDNQRTPLASIPDLPEALISHPEFVKPGQGGGGGKATVVVAAAKPKKGGPTGGPKGEPTTKEGPKRAVEKEKEESIKSKTPTPQEIKKTEADMRRKDATQKARKILQEAQRQQSEEAQAPRQQLAEEAQRRQLAEEAQRRQLAEEAQRRQLAEAQELLTSVENAKTAAREKATNEHSLLHLLFSNQDNLLLQLLASPYTMCATFSRICSGGGLIIGKGMEYFFGTPGNGYYQLPYFFKNFDKFLKVCHQYDTTELIYSSNIPPYNLLHPLPNSPFLPHIEEYFTKLKIVLNTGGLSQSQYIQQKLAQNTADIAAIREYLTGDFMQDPTTLDDSTTVSGASSASSLSSQASRQSNSCKQLDELSQYNPQLREPLAFYLCLGPLDSQSVGSCDTQGDVNLSQNLDGGTLLRVPSSATTMKNMKKIKYKKNNSLPPSLHTTNNKSKRIRTHKHKRKSYMPRNPRNKHTIKKVKKHNKPNKTMRRYRRVRK